MLRRTFLVILSVSSLGWPRFARAQSGTKIWRIAHFYPGRQEPADSPYWDAFRDELRTLGYIEGKNLIIDYNYADGQVDRLPSLAKKLVSLHPDVIVAVTTLAIAAAQRETSTIPIVMCPATDPIGSGFVKTYAHPGGNITGTANMVGEALGKAVELLHLALPKAKRIAVLTSGNPTHSQQYALFEAAAKRLGLEAVRAFAPGPEDLVPAFENIVREACDALFVLADITRSEIVTLADRAKLPAIYQTQAFVRLGGLASYSANLMPVFRRAAHYVDKICKGAAPGEIPVEQPVTFELAINLKAAASLGVTFPDSLIARAEIIVE